MGLPHRRCANCRHFVHGSPRERDFWPTQHGHCYRQFADDQSGEYQAEPPYPAHANSRGCKMYEEKETCGTFIPKHTGKPVYADDMIREWLKSHGYDGLYHEDDECGCRLDDLCPCESSPAYCLPGYAHEDENGDYFGIYPTRQDDPDKKLDERKDRESVDDE